MIAQLEWQTTVSLVIVAIAIVYLFVRLLGIGRADSKSCGSCHSCSDDQTKVKVRKLIQIGDQTDKTQ